MTIEERKKWNKSTGRDYSKEKKFQSSPKQRKYRSELNKYNRDKNTYGNGDGKDASHEGGKIVGFESQSKNRGRKEKSRMKKKTNEIFLNEGVYDQGILKAVFTAGGPGSGKSFISDEILGIPKNLSFSMQGLKVVNVDQAYEYFLTKGGFGKNIASMSKKDQGFVTSDDPNSPRTKGKKVTGRKFNLYQDGRLGVLIDGTGKDYDKIDKQKKMMEDLGYDTFMVFVSTTLEVAQKRNAARERKLGVDMVEKFWSETMANENKYKKLFGKNIIVYDNSADISPNQKFLDSKYVQKHVSGKIRQWVKQPIQNPKGKQWVENELKKKNTKSENTNTIKEELKYFVKKQVALFLKEEEGTGSPFFAVKIKDIGTVLVSANSASTVLAQVGKKLKNGRKDIISVSRVQKGKSKRALIALGGDEENNE